MNNDWTYRYMTNAIFVCSLVYICCDASISKCGYAVVARFVNHQMHRTSMCTTHYIQVLCESFTCAQQESEKIEKHKRNSTRKHECEWKKPSNGQREKKWKERMEKAKIKWELNQQVRSSTKVENLGCAQIHTWRTESVCVVQCVHIAISLKRWKNKYEVHFSLAWSIRKTKKKKSTRFFSLPLLLLLFISLGFSPPFYL